MEVKTGTLITEGDIKAVVQMRGSEGPKPERNLEENRRATEEQCEFQM